MLRIPLEATIFGAYKFFFRNIISIIGTVWFVSLVYAAVVAAFIFALMPHGWSTIHFSRPEDVAAFVTGHLGVIAVGAPVIAIVGLLAGAMIRVGILERAVGKRTGLTLFYFTLGAPVWRMIVAEILSIAVLIVVVVAAITGGVALHYAFAAIPNVPVAVSILFYVVLVVGLFAAVIYVGVRLFFFLPAVIIAENRISLGRSWSLGGGNVGRAVVIFLAVFIPVSIVTGMVNNVTIMPALMTEAMRHGNNPSPGEAAALLEAILPYLPVMIAAHLAGALLMTGTLLGAIGGAYQTLTAAKPD